jgi:hypothetical protein
MDRYFAPSCRPPRSAMLTTIERNERLNSIPAKKSDDGSVAVQSSGLRRQDFELSADREWLELYGTALSPSH